MEKTRSKIFETQIKIKNLNLLELKLKFMNLTYLKIKNSIYFNFRFALH